MFIGHFAVALAAKRAAPEVSLGTLFLAAQLADLVWPTLVLLGVEAFTVRPGITAVTPLEFTRYPYSHSLMGMAVWGAGLGLTYHAFRRRVPAAFLLFGVVLSHWVLDFVTHRPDLPLAPGLGTRVGLGLWSSKAATIAVEGALFAIGLGLYLRATRARGGAGHLSLWSLVAFLVLVYAANLAGPPPPDPGALALVGLAMFLFIPWAAWIGRTRVPAAERPA